MNKRIRKKKFGEWAFIKYKGDIAIYAACQTCGYTYNASSSVREFINGEVRWSMPKPDLTKLHNYCPHCGRKMKPFNGTEIYKLDKWVYE